MQQLIHDRYSGQLGVCSYFDDIKTLKNSSTIWGPSAKEPDDIDAATTNVIANKTFATKTELVILLQNGAPVIQVQLDAIVSALDDDCDDCQSDSQSVP